MAESVPSTLGGVWRVLTAGAAIAAALAVGGAASAQEPPPTTAPPPVEEGESGVLVEGGVVAEQPPLTLPLVPVPTGCDAPPLPHIVFVGAVVEHDYRSVRFQIEQIRAGQAFPFSGGNVIDVRYGAEAQYLDQGERYVVGAGVDPDLGLLVSHVAPATENFGGDEVIGVSETDVTCPRFDDPARTLHLDGTEVATPLLEPLQGARFRILSALVVPSALAMAAIFVLAALRLSLGGAYRAVSDATRR
jgi:hypothetical protein